MCKAPRLLIVSFLLPLAILSAKADELKGHVQTNDGARVARPAMPSVSAEAAVTDGMGKPLDSSLDVGSFDLNARRSNAAVDLSGWNPWAGVPRRNLHSSLDRLAVRRPILAPVNLATTVLDGNADLHDLHATEARWRGSLFQSDTGATRIMVNANIAFCPPRDPVLRQQWATFMRELQNPATAAMWKNWQDEAAKRLGQAQAERPQQYVQANVHITVLPDQIRIDGLPPRAPWSDDLAGRLSQALQGLTLPPGTGVHEAHIRASMSEVPAMTP